MMTPQPRRDNSPSRPAIASLFLGHWADLVCFSAMLAFLGVCALCGGTSFSDTAVLLILRPFAVVLISLWLLLRQPLDWRSIKVPLIFFGLFAASIAIQLVPLPPDIWTGLPGRSDFAAPAQIANFPQPWRPLSLTPALTLDSLVSLVVPLAVLIGYAALRPDQRRALLPALLVIMICSAILGIAQLASGPVADVYYYRVANRGSPVGFFANHNHNAVFLALGLPLYALWLRQLAPERRGIWTILGIPFGLLMLVTVLASGSRSGMLIAALGLAVAVAVWAGQRGLQRRGRAFWIRAGVAGGIVALAGIVAYWQGRATSIDRLFQADAFLNEGRPIYFEKAAHIAAQMFPFGSGFGSFDIMYRRGETLADLDLLFVNHAHNDYIELLMTGGLAAVAVAGASILWMIWTSLKSLRGGRFRAMFWCGVSVVVGLMLASLTDYPLRTPLMGAIFALAWCWLGSPERGQRDALRPPADQGAAG